MSDRLKKSGWGVVLLIVLVLIAAGGWYYLSGSSRWYEAAAPLNVPAYVESAKSLRGNTYRLEGEVLTLLAWSPSGRIFSVGIEDGKKALPVLVPSKFNSVNVEKGQRFRFLLVVDDQGVLRVERLAKP